MIRTRRLVALALLLAAGACARIATEKKPLEEVYSPHFYSVPPRESVSQTIHTLAQDWKAGTGDTFIEDVLSIQGLSVAVAAAVILIVAWDYRRPRSPRNADVILMLGAGLFLFDSLRFFRVQNHPSYLNLIDWVFSLVFVLGIVLIVRAVWRVRVPAPEPWTPNANARTLAAIAIALLAGNMWLLMSRSPDDAGFFVNLGAQRLRERGWLPYGDPLLTGTPGAAYGPLLYAAHVPFQIAVSPDPVNASSPARPDLTKYYVPPRVATQLCTAFFHLAGVAALFFSTRALAGPQVAWGLVCLYCGSLAVLGIGGRDESVAGITFISHIGPAATVLLAFAALGAPAVAGALLAIGTGVGFYPAFMFPAWLGYFWNGASRRWRFVAGFAVAAMIIAAGVYAFSRPANNRSRIGTIVYDTVGHHTDPAGYGSSPFGFWGQREGIRRVLGTPLASSGMTSPAWLGFAGFICATFFLARGRRPADLALLSGAIAIGATLVKPHATGTYLAWYYPLLLIGFLAAGRSR